MDKKVVSYLSVEQDAKLYNSLAGGAVTGWDLNLKDGYGVLSPLATRPISRTATLGYYWRNQTQR